MILVPKYDELSSIKIWNFVKEISNLLQYFPDLSSSTIPDRTYLFTILSTQKGEELNKLIKKSRDMRAVQNEVDENQIIEIRKDIKDEIFALLNKRSKLYITFYSATKGRANFLLKKGEVLTNKKNERKRHELNLSTFKSKQRRTTEEESIPFYLHNLKY